jgi:hypothetical protein
VSAKRRTSVIIPPLWQNVEGPLGGRRSIPDIRIEAKRRALEAIVAKKAGTKPAEDRHPVLLPCA